jgi:hypothetical protein
MNILISMRYAKNQLREWCHIGSGIENEKSNLTLLGVRAASKSAYSG